jgi:hypothetical protein
MDEPISPKELLSRSADISEALLSQLEEMRSLPDRRKTTLANKIADNIAALNEVLGQLSPIRAIINSLHLLPSSIPQLSQLTNNKRSALLNDLATALSVLTQLSISADSIRHPQNLFDPSDPATVGKLIVETLLKEPREPLRNLDTATKFYGSGVYAIYYLGGLKVYAPISGTEVPIYVGKADPSTPIARTAKEQGAKLWERLRNDHSRSINAASSTLNIAEFECRFLVVRSAWQGTAEEYLINSFKPVWNNESGVCYGFGKHGDSHKKRSNTRSPWDTLHPGRKWATKKGNTPNPKSTKEIELDIKRHFDAHLRAALQASKKLS